MGLLRGPCNQCGVITTLPWRVGPPEKPELVLCIACGTKYYRTRGTLANLAPTKKFPGYSPKRPTCSEDNSETKYDSEDDSETKCASSSPSSSLQRVDGDQIPGNSRTRSGTTLSDLSHIENLQRDPFSAVEHDPGASDSAEDVVLIYNANSLFVSPNEIGLGAVLLKPTSSDVNTMDGTTDESKDQSKASCSELVDTTVTFLHNHAQGKDCVQRNHDRRVSKHRSRFRTEQLQPLSETGLAKLHPFKSLNQPLQY